MTPPRPKQLFKWLIALALHASGVLAWLRRRQARAGRVPVLCFHRVAGARGAHLPLAVPVEAFGKLVDGLARRYRIASWEACVRAARQGSSRPHVALSFDDGYADAFDTVWPLLRGVGGTAIFCPILSFVEGAPLWWEVIAARRPPGDGPRFPVDHWNEAGYGEEALAEIERLKRAPQRVVRAQVERESAKLADAEPLSRAMSWQQLERMAAEGAQFAGHGLTHAVLPNCSDAELDAEIEGCRRALASHLDATPTLFAYPNGASDERVVAALQRAGFRYAFGTQRGHYHSRCDPLWIPRLTISERTYSLSGDGFSWPLFEAEILGVFEALRRIRARRTAEA